MEKYCIKELTCYKSNMSFLILTRITVNIHNVGRSSNFTQDATWLVYYWRKDKSKDTHLSRLIQLIKLEGSVHYCAQLYWEFWKENRLHVYGINSFLISIENCRLRALFFIYSFFFSFLIIDFLNTFLI